jgi:hypothetical protein
MILKVLWYIDQGTRSEKVRWNMPKCSVLKMIHTRCLVIYPVLDKEYITNWQNLMQGHMIMHKAKMPRKLQGLLWCSRHGWKKGEGCPCLHFGFSLNLFCLAGIVLWRGGGVGANQNTSAQGTEGGWIRAQGRSMISFVWGGMSIH